MSENAKSSCSPYLLKTRRELAVACRQVSQSRGEPVPPCAACTLKDMCRPRLTAELIRLPRPRTTVRKDTAEAQAA